MGEYREAFSHAGIACQDPELLSEHGIDVAQLMLAVQDVMAGFVAENPDVDDPALVVSYGLVRGFVAGRLSVAPDETAMVV